MRREQERKIGVPNERKPGKERRGTAAELNKRDMGLQRSHSREQREASVAGERLSGS